MTPQRNLLRQRLTDMPIRSKMLFAGSVIAALFLAFVISSYLSYARTVQSQQVSAMLERALFAEQRVLTALHGAAVGDAAAVKRAHTAATDGQDVLRALVDAYPQTGAAADVRARVLPAWSTLAGQLASVGAGTPDADAVAAAAAGVQTALQQVVTAANADAQLANLWSARLLGAVFVLIVLTIFALFLWLYRNIGGRLTRINDAISAMEATGDLSLRLEVNANDEIGHLAATCNNLAQSTQAMMERERQDKEDQDEMIALVHDAVEAAARGDLTHVLMDFHGGNRIDQLANGIRAMIDSLNRLIGEVREGAFTVAQSSSELAASTTQQEATTTELAASTNQISASTTEIAATAQELVASMDEVFQVMQSASDNAASGQSSIDSMEDSMRTMVSAVDTIAAKLQTLNEKAGNIGTVVTTINKVADQTNLLSLNAAIEAEKAGEYGRGFAVVATEIRRLADQTAVSTWDIEQMVKEIQSAASACVMAMEKVSGEIHKGAENVSEVGGELTGIIDKVQTLLPGFEAVKESIHGQSDGARQISESIQQMNESAQETAESLRRSGEAVHRLKEAVQVLNNGVARFAIG